MPTNTPPEYLILLRQVISCLMTNLYDPRLRQLTPQEILDWFHRVELEDVETVLPEATSVSPLAGCPASCGGSDFRTFTRILE